MDAEGHAGRVTDAPRARIASGVGTTWGRGAPSTWHRGTEDPPGVRWAVEGPVGGASLHPGFLLTDMKVVCLGITAYETFVIVRHTEMCIYTWRTTYTPQTM